MDGCPQEAVHDMERTCEERDRLAEQLGSKSRCLRRAEKRLDACDRELTQLRRDHGAKIAAVAELQATNHTCCTKVTMLWSIRFVMAIDSCFMDEWGSQ